MKRQNNTKQYKIREMNELIELEIHTLCIPRVFSHINESKIRKTFDALNMGIIGRIDIIKPQLQKEQTYNRVFIHYKKWFSEGNATIAKERLLNGQDIKVIYDEPWFWKVSNYRNLKIKTNHKQDKQQDKQEDKQEDKQQDKQQDKQEDKENTKNKEYKKDK